MLDARAVAAAVEQAHRDHWSNVLAATIRVTGDLDLAEECAQEAYVRALGAWPCKLPDNPGGWLTTAARRLALDRRRRAITARRALPRLAIEAAGDDEPSARPGHDGTDPLRLLFLCCHPALSRDAQLALTLRLMCGLTTTEIGRVLLAQDTAIAARITRAKRKIAAAGVPFRLPDERQQRARLDTVLAVVQLTYTAGHTATTTDDDRGEATLVRGDLTHRAETIARRLVAAYPDESEPEALLAVILFSEARRRARLSPDGDLVLLADQDRSQWDRIRLHEGLAHATAALGRGDGPYTFQAAIAGLHAAAPSFEQTDWPQVVEMYDRLLARWPTPVVALNRLAAVSLTPDADLEAVRRDLDALDADGALDRYPYLPATQADVLARLGHVDAAIAAYDEALARSGNDVERRFLSIRRDRLGRRCERGHQLSRGALDAELGASSGNRPPAGGAPRDARGRATTRPP